MSNLRDRRNSPRRRVNSEPYIGGRLLLIVYSSLPLIGFTFTGAWWALCLGLTMLKLGLRPLKRGDT